MSLRLRIVLSLAALAAAATSVASGTAYWSTKTQLYDTLDASLDEVAELVKRTGDRPMPRVSNTGTVSNTTAPYSLPSYRDIERETRHLVYATQLLDREGNVIPRTIPDYDGDRTLPVDATDRAVATNGGSSRRDVDTDGQELRLLTVALRNGGAVQIARDLSETTNVLDSLRTRYVALALAVSAAAAALGLWIAQRVTRPLVQLTGAVEQVTRTRQFDHAVAGEGRDETGRLAAAFNQMLGALARSRDQQQQLVQDAGHELRTPLTSLRTNVSILRKHERLSPDQMARTVDDISSELVELSTLVNEIVELATDRRDDEPVQLVDLRSIVERCAERIQRRKTREVRVVADGSLVNGRVNALERAIGNLIDNAAKFDPTAAPIDVEVRDGRISVRDHGPGIAPDDLPHVFERFYRSVAARSTTGSGLGLAIVSDIVTNHGGRVDVANAPGGGAVFTIELPTA